MNEIRLKRVESLIRDKVSALIMTGEVKDPRVDSSVTLTRVKAAKDLASARIWISSFGGEEATRRAVKGLTNAAGFIQSRIGREMHMRNTPKLFFSADNSIREGLEVNRLIDQAMKSSAAAEQGSDMAETSRLGSKEHEAMKSSAAAEQGSDMAETKEGIESSE